MKQAIKQKTKDTLKKIRKNQLEGTTFLGGWSEPIKKKEKKYE